MSECRINGGRDTRCDHGTGGCTVNHEVEYLRATVARLEAKIETLESEKEDLDSSRSSMVSHRDLEIRDLKAELKVAASSLDDALATVARLEATVAKERAVAASIRRVLEDCHAHDLYVGEGAEAHDHDRSMRAAIAGDLGGEMLDELRDLARQRDEAVVERDAARNGLAEADKWVMRHVVRVPHIDHACAECIPDGSILSEGFRCVPHAAKARTIAARDGAK